VIVLLNNPNPSETMAKAVLIQELQKSETYKEKKDDKAKN
jgi:hypothetical protein